MRTFHFSSRCQVVESESRRSKYQKCESLKDQINIWKIDRNILYKLSFFEQFETYCVVEITVLIILRKIYAY